MQTLINDLLFMKSAIKMTGEALRLKDEKLARSCIQAIQNHLNSKHHPIAFYSMLKIYDGSKN